MFIMKLIFVEAQKKQPIDISSVNFSILPAQVFLAYSVQYKKLAEQIKRKLGKRVKEFRQVLGCTKLKSKYVILLVGSGKFHALHLALQGNSVYILEENNITKLNKEEIDKIKAKRKTAFIKFLAAEKIGILVSAKPGQENFKKALKLRKNLVKNGKEPFVFLADNINIGDLENYSIEGWLNTSCKALTFDSRILNMHELEEAGYC